MSIRGYRFQSFDIGTVGMVGLVGFGCWAVGFKLSIMRTKNHRRGGAASASRRTEVARRGVLTGRVFQRLFTPHPSGGNSQLIRLFL